MNKKIALPAIAMFAVIMGMGAFAPAIADKPTEVAICHFDDDGSVSSIIINENAVKAHLGDDKHEAHSNDLGTDYLDDGSCPVTEDEDEAVV